MSDDPLKALLTETATPPRETDIRFVVAVIERVEREKLKQDLILLLTVGSAVTACLWVLMPALTPWLFGAMQALTTIVTPACVLATLAFSVYAARPALTLMGIRV